MLQLNFGLARHFMILSLLFRAVFMCFMCESHLYLLFIVNPNIFKLETEGILMLFDNILQVQFCFRQMWRC